MGVGWLSRTSIMTPGACGHNEEYLLDRFMKLKGFSPLKIVKEDYHGLKVKEAINLLNQKGIHFRKWKSNETIDDPYIKE